MPELLAAWLITWWLHATALILGAWLLTRARARLPLALQEWLWRGALFGGLLTATVAVAWTAPWAPRVDLPALAAAAPSAAPEAAAPDDASALAVPAPVPVASPPAAATLPIVEPAPPPAARSAAQAWHGFAVLWLAVVVVLGVRGARARRRLARILAGRRPITRGPLRTTLMALGREAGWRRPVALAEIDGLDSPLAVGLRRPEIVVPARVAADLSPRQQATMLAHELAHHARRDPLWSACARAVATILWMQPLHVLALRRLRALGELRADAWAARRTGDARALAECLAVVAGWRVAGRLAPATPMAAYGSMLEQRVARLLAPAAAGATRGTAWLALVPLVAVLCLAPVAGPVLAGGVGDDVAPTRVAASPPTPAAAGGDMAALDREFQALRRELLALLDLLGRVEDPPPALTEAVRRLTARLPALVRQRDALARALQETDR